MLAKGPQQPVFELFYKEEAQLCLPVKAQQDSHVGVIFFFVVVVYIFLTHRSVLFSNQQLCD